MKTLFLFILLLVVSFVHAQESPKNFVPVLMYHKISSNDPAGYTVISEPKFLEHVQLLKQLGYVTLTISELGKYLSTGAELPKKAVALTFDDGWKSSIITASILSYYDMSATFYIISGMFQDPRYLNKEDLEHLSKNTKFEIGAHSHTHFMKWIADFQGIDSGTLNDEVAQSKTIIEHVIRKKVTSFSWPFGFTRPDSVEFAKSVGFTTTVFVTEDTHNVADTPAMNIRRINVDGRCTAADLEEMLTLGMVKDCK